MSKGYRNNAQALNRKKETNADEPQKNGKRRMSLKYQSLWRCQECLNLTVFAFRFNHHL